MTADGLVAALGERLSAQAERVTTTLRLALAEARLAASSAALLAGIAFAAAVLGMIVWLLLVALAGYGLWSLGLGVGVALLVLLAVHVAAMVLLALAARRLLRDLSFAHTRGALAARTGEPRPASPPNAATVAARRSAPTAATESEPRVRP